MAIKAYGYIYNKVSCNTDVWSCPFNASYFCEAGVKAYVPLSDEDKALVTMAYGDIPVAGEGCGSGVVAALPFLSSAPSPSFIISPIKIETISYTETENGGRVPSSLTTTDTFYQRRVDPDMGRVTEIKEGGEIILGGTNELYALAPGEPEIDEVIDVGVVVVDKPSIMSGSANMYPMRIRVYGDLGKTRPVVYATPETIRAVRGPADIAYIDIYGRDGLIDSVAFIGDEAGLNNYMGTVLVFVDNDGVERYFAALTLSWFEIRQLSVRCPVPAFCDSDAPELRCTVDDEPVGTCPLLR